LSIFLVELSRHLVQISRLVSVNILVGLLSIQRLMPWYKVMPSSAGFR